MTAHPVPRRRDHRDLQHRAGAGARGRGLDVDLVQGRPRRARRRGAVDPRRRRRRRAVRQRLRVPGPLSPAWVIVVVAGDPRGARRPRRRSRRAWPPRCSCIGGRRGRLHRPGVDRTVDPAEQRVRRAVRHVHRGRVRARRRAATCTCYGTKPDALATVAAMIRNNGHVQPRGGLPRARARSRRRTSSTAAWSPTRSTCSTARRRPKAGAARAHPRRLAADAADAAGVRPRRQRRQRSAPRTRTRPTWELGGHRRADLVNGTVGRRAARGLRSALPGSAPTDVDVCEFYDPFSFEIIRQFEAFGFCGEGEGGDFVMGGTIEPGGQYPVTTDGGVMSFSHAGASAQMLQRVIRGVRAAARRRARRTQVEGAEVAHVLQRRLGRAVQRRDAAGSRAAMTRARNRRPARSRSRTPDAHAALLGRLRARRAAVPALRRLRPRDAHARVPVQPLHVAEPHVGARARAPARSTAGPRCGVRRCPSFEVPYAAIIVDMDEGWQILSNLIGCEHDAVEIGMRVEVEFHEMDGGFTLPYFRPRLTAVQQGLAALRVVDSAPASPAGTAPRLLADAGADVVKVEPPGGDPWRAWSAGGATVDPDDGRRAVPVPAPRHALGRRRARGRRGRGARRRRRRRRRELRCRRVRPAAAGSTRTRASSCARSRRTAAPGPYAERPTTEFIVQAESGGLVGRGSVAQRPVPGRRAHQRVVGGHVLGDGGRRGRVARGSARATASTSTSRSPR